MHLVYVQLQARYSEDNYRVQIKEGPMKLKIKITPLTPVNRFHPFLAPFNKGEIPIPAPVRVGFFCNISFCFMVKQAQCYVVSHPNSGCYVLQPFPSLPIGMYVALPQLTKNKLI